MKIEPVCAPVWNQKLSPPHKYALSISPNSFNPTVTIALDLPKAMQVQFCIFDIMGRVVTTITNENFLAGLHQFCLDSSMYLSGVYFARLQTDHFNKTWKLILLK